MRYGLYFAKEIVKQAELFLSAVSKPENSSARGKLESEGFNSEEENRGKALLEKGRKALAGAETGHGSVDSATTSQEKAHEELIDAFSRRVKKTRAKLMEDDNNKVLIEALNSSIRNAGHSYASLIARVETFLEVMQKSFTRPSENNPVTIKQAANITQEQETEIRNKLDAFKKQMSAQDHETAKKLDLTEEKENSIRQLDRWLAKWQHICKADFSESQLTSFGITLNRPKIRRRQKDSTESTPQ